LKNVFEITFSAIAFMCYWTGMHSEETHMMISMGVNLMVSNEADEKGEQCCCPSDDEGVESKDEDGEKAVGEMDSKP
jgi:hypothetical protein